MMADEKQVRKYRVRPGMTHGLSDQYTEGDIVEMTEEEARPFLDKLEPVRPTEGEEQTEQMTEVVENDLANRRRNRA